jgi:hypothetical protein
MSIIQGNAHTSAGGGYQIERSLRFNSADSAYLNRTFGSPTAQNTWTISCWLKRGALSTQQTIFSAGTSNRLEIIFASNNTLQIADASTNFIVTTPVYRDPSSWYHIVIRANGSGSAMQVYVNNVVTTNSTTNNLTTSYWNASGTVGYIGSLGGFSSNYLNGYLAEINFIDGQALTPSSFGETDSATGVWKPKAYTGTYGTNGFFLKFADNSNTTAATLGKDSSGNGNNWTPNNFSVTAGAGNDSLVDSPTSYGTDTGVGGEVRSNYATWNPLYGSTPTLTNGNLDATTNNTTAYGTVSVTSGKWYWEILVGNASYIGVMDSTYIKPDGNWSSQAVAYVSNGNKYNGTGSAYGASYTTNDIIGVALDMDAGTIVFYKNGSSQGTAFSSGIAGKEFRPFVYSSTSGTQTANFGQRAFAYTAPSGFKALCTQNLPTPTIGATSTTQADNYFDIVLRNGFGTSGGSITSVQFQPDFIWEKRRTVANHQLVDSVRGVTKYLSSNLTDAEVTLTTYFTSFNSNGYTLGAGDYGTGDALVDWIWRAGGTGVTNTAGTITSTVSANTTSGFSIISYTGNKTSGATIGHGLGVAPAMVIFKERANVSEWIIYHQSLGATQSIYFSTAAANTNSIWFNNTAPSSTVITLGNADGTNRANTMIAYAFAPVAGYSAFGRYTGNGSNDGVFVYTGFRPRWILVKRTDSTSGWHLYDTARDTYNAATKRLQPDLSNAENTANGIIDILSNGWKFRNTNTDWDASGGTYIYAAFAETPAKFSLAR